MFYNPQVSIDRINSQIAELEKLKSQVPNIQPITQNFQIAPQNAFRYANSIDEVQKEYVIADTPFFSEIASKFSDKICLITMPSHITCSIYGCIVDSFDCRHRPSEFLWIVKD